MMEIERRVEASTLRKRAQIENRARARPRPLCAADLQPLSHKRFARGLHDSAAKIEIVIRSVDDDLSFQVRSLRDNRACLPLDTLHDRRLVFLGHLAKLNRLKTVACCVEERDRRDGRLLVALATNVERQRVDVDHYCA